MSGDIDQITIDLINQHLELENLRDAHRAWTIEKSTLDDRGVFATRDIKEGEIIFIDYPLIIGPRNTSEHICASCWHSNNKLTVCSDGCGLALCSEVCRQHNEHTRACAQIKKWKSRDIEGDYTKFLITPIRALNMSKFQRDVIRCLAGYERARNVIELKVMKDELNFNVDSSDEDWIKRVCTVMNVNAFEVLLSADMPTARGLYVLSSLMNHSCQPNVMHLYNDKRHMIVKAARDIRKGEEIFNTYVRLIWGTLSRRQYLLRTKQFACACKRCSDPTEFGTYMNAISCPQCENRMLPINPLDMESDWLCNQCKHTLIADKVRFMMKVILQRLESNQTENVADLLNFYNQRIAKCIPECNQLIIQYKYMLIWALGYGKDYTLPELPENLLQLKEKYCLDLLDIVEKLQLGSCKIRGLLLQELYKCRHEKDSRLGKVDFNQNEMNSDSFNIKVDRNKDLLEESKKIVEFGLIASKNVV